MHSDVPTQKEWLRVCRLIDDVHDDVLESTWLAYGIDLLEKWPTRLRVAPLGWLQRIVHGEQLPQMKLVCGLSGHAQLSADDYRVLFNSKQLDGITHFFGRGSHMTNEVIMHLVDSTLLSKIKHLDISNNPALRSVTQTIFTLGDVSALQVYDAGGVVQTPEDLWALSQNESIGALHTLLFPRCGINGKALDWLGQSTHMNTLRHLDLSGNPLDLHAARILASASNLMALQTLRVFYSGFETDPASRHALSTSPYLSESIRSQFV